jgi:hypothetical protein
MVWHIPNEADAPEDPRQAALQSAALDGLAAGIAGTGIVSGFGFTAAGGLAITVAAGVSAVAGVTSSAAGGSISVTATSSTQNRIDLVAVNGAGALVVVQGTPVAGSALPAEPAATGGLVALFVVFLGPSTTTISADNISDRRVVAAPTGPQGDQGEPGEQGEPGTAGAQGDPGTPALWNFTGAYSGGAAYAVGDVATYAGQTFYRINSNGGNLGDTPVEGTFWTLLAADGAQGDPGPQGDPGETGTAGAAGDRYATTSSTSLTIGHGTKTLTVGLGLAYTAAQSVVIANDPNNHIHGTVTSYNAATGALVVEEDKHTGAGTFTAWTVNLDGALSITPGTIPEQYIRAVGYYQTTPYNATATSYALGTTMANACTQTHISPIYLERITTYDLIAVQLVTPATDAGAVIELGWAPALTDRSGGPDYTAITSAGSISATGAAGEYSIAINAQLTAGTWYLMAALKSATTKAGTVPAIRGTITPLAIYSATTLTTNAAQMQRGSRATDAALTTSVAGAPYSTATQPTVGRIGVRVSSWP